MCKFWYDFIKSKYQDNAKLCYMDTDSFIIHIKTNGAHEDIVNDIEEWFSTSNYECDRPLPARKNIKVIGQMKDELGGKIMAGFVALGPKTYSYLIDDDSEAKKAKCNDHKDCLLNNETSAGKVCKTELLSKYK